MKTAKCQNVTGQKRNNTNSIILFFFSCRNFTENSTLTVFLFYFSNFIENLEWIKILGTFWDIYIN